MNEFGFARIAVASPVTTVGNPEKNVESILSILHETQVQNCDVIVFPELCITGYTCGDLFRQESLQVETMKAICRLTLYSRRVAPCQLIFVGAPFAVRNQLFNCAFAIHDGRVIGIVPKQNIPNYNEFYESRWFRSADGNEQQEVLFEYRSVPFGTDLLFETKNHLPLSVAVEICEDLWMPIPPSSYAAIAGANVLVNLSASNETVAKNEYRVDLVKNQSGRCVAAYGYASAGPSESTTDVVFGGHSLICENGNLLAETSRIGDGNFDLGARWAVADVDINRLQTERQLMTSFGDSKRWLNGRSYRSIPWLCPQNVKSFNRRINGRPFVPQDEKTLNRRCTEVFEIQCAGLAKRLQQLSNRSEKPVPPDVYIGVSGGLDSTLALLVTHKVYQSFGWPTKNIHGITLPGFGTTEKTKSNALKLMEQLDIDQQTIDIRQICLQTWKALGHKPFNIDFNQMSLKEFEGWLGDVPKERRHDLVFENVQARERTKILMSKGFVIGTGDMSELALGWCTYNGDHMSMYGVNCSIPKTLVKFLVRFVAQTEYQNKQETRETLLSIADTVISPELLPAGGDGEIEQSTESILGPYELHDFFLAHFTRYGFSPSKILFLANHAEFEVKYSQEVIKNTLRTFISRFFPQQFKRSCVPDGPKVGSVSLSPRGDWRMPSDADPTAWLKEIAT